MLLRQARRGSRWAAQRGRCQDDFCQPLAGIRGFVLLHHLIQRRYVFQALVALGAELQYHSGKSRLLPPFVGFPAEICRDQRRPANHFISFDCEIDLRTAWITADDGGFDPQRFFHESRYVMTGGASSGSAALGRLLSVAQILHSLKRRVGSDEMKHFVFFRRADPGEPRPVEFYFRASDQLVEIKRRIESADRKTVGFRKPVDVVCRYASARAPHVLLHDRLMTGGMLADMLRYQTLP